MATMRIQLCYSKGRWLALHNVDLGLHAHLLDNRKLKYVGKITLIYVDSVDYGLCNFDVDDKSVIVW